MLQIYPAHLMHPAIGIDFATFWRFDELESPAKIRMKQIVLPTATTAAYQDWTRDEIRALTTYFARWAGFNGVGT